MTKISNIIKGTSSALAMLAVSVVAVVNPVGAETAQDGADVAKADNVPGDLNSVFGTAVNILLYVIGAISVIMLIVGGIRYTVSNGDSTQITNAKNTIMYAIVGLVIAFLAYAIVNWILGGLASAN